MRKSLALIAILFIASALSGQQHTAPALDTDNVFTGANVFKSLDTSLPNTWTAAQTGPFIDKGGAVYNVLAYGAKGDWNGSTGTDDTAAIQSALNVAAVSGGVVFFPAKSYYVTGTITHTNPSNVSIEGYGATIVVPSLQSGATGTGYTFKLGDSTGAVQVLNFKMLGLRFKGGSWNASTGNFIVGQNTNDVVLTYTMRDAEFDVSCYNVGGKCLYTNGYLPSVIPFEHFHIRVRGMDVGTGWFGFLQSVGTSDVQIRRAHNNGVYLFNAGGVTLTTNIDETLMPNSNCSVSCPSTAATDGNGVVLEDVDWSYVYGSSDIARRAALLMRGNTKENVISGNFYDSSTLTNGGYGNISLDTNGTNTPSRNKFYLGFTGYSGNVTNPTDCNVYPTICLPNYGINQIAPASFANNVVYGIDALGVGTGVAGGKVGVTFVSDGPAGITSYVDPATNKLLNFKRSGYGVDVDSDQSVGDGTVVDSWGNGAYNFRLCVKSTDSCTFHTVRLGGASDVGLSRGAAGQVNIGNGTAGDASGTLALAGVKIAGATTITGQSGTGGTVAMTTSPVFTTPNIGAATTALQLTSTLATGTAPFSITSTTPVANLTTVPVTYSAGGTQQVGTHIVMGHCTLGTSCSITLVGSAVFSSSSSYECSATDETAAAAVKFAPSSGSAFALTGTGTDVLSYHCVGN